MVDKRILVGALIAATLSAPKAEEVKPAKPRKPTFTERRKAEKRKNK